MTKSKGFPRNRRDYKEPRMYEVRFESGHTELIMATSSIDARTKSLPFQETYGFYTGSSQTK